MRCASLSVILLSCGLFGACARNPLEPAALAQARTLAGEAGGAGEVLAQAAPAAAAPRAGVKTADYLDAALRREVESLLASVAAEPTTASTCGARARVLWRWANAWSLTGRYVSQEAISLPASVAASEARGEPCAPRVLADIDVEAKELAARDRSPDAFGSVRLVPPREPLHATGWVTIEQTFTVGSRAIGPGGSFLLGNQIMADQGDIQNRDAAGDAYVSARASNAGVVLATTTHDLGGRHGGFKGAKPMPVFRVASGTLAPGDTVTFTYGDRTQGSKGLRLQSVSTDNLLLPIYVDLDGSGRYAGTEWPPIQLAGVREAADVAVFAPSVIASGEPFDVAVRTEDRYRNRSAAASPGYEVMLDGRTIARLAPGGDALAIAKGLRLDAAGTYRFTVRSTDGALHATSNPVWVEERPDRRVYWGELHGHSGYAEGQGAADQFFRYAREDARLDFVSLTDHDTNLDDFEWRLLREKTAQYHRDGEFVAFLGYEWSPHREMGGHHNVFFRTPDRDRVPRQEAPVLDALYPRLARENDPEDVLIVPHAHNAADWNKSDADLERLVEISSMHGTFEWFGNQYLRNGFEVGFISASDDHRSKPGLATGLFFSPQLQPGGLAAAIAPSKTGDAIFDALRGLSAYATSGDRILLDARLNGERMGTRQPSSARRRIRARASGTSPIDRIDIVKNGEVAWSESYLGTPLEDHAFIQVAFESSSEVFPPPRDNPREYRVWSGTLDVEGAKVVGLRTTGLKNAYVEWARIDPERPNRIAFYAETRGKADSLLVELDGASAATRFVFDLVAARESGFEQGIRPLADIPAVNVALALADLDDSRLDHVLPVGRHQDRLTLQVVDVGAALDRELEFTDLGEARDGDYYYVRVTQLDGSQAWSSPFWVGPAPPKPTGG